MNQGYVYAIGPDPLTEVKIGWSAFPERRLSTLQNGNPRPLTVLGMISATEDQEAELLTLLEPWRIHGEWFRPEGPVLAFLSMLPAPTRRGERPAVTRDVKTVARVIKDLGGLAAVADLTGVGYTAAHNWKVFGKFPPRTYMLMTKALGARGLTAPASLWGLS